MKIITTLVIASSLTFAQTPAPPTSAPASNVSSALPSLWVGSGAGYNPAGSPKNTAWLSVAVNTGQGVYSYSSYDVTPVRGQVPVISTRTGVATVKSIVLFKQTFFFITFGTAGVAQSATAVTSSFSGGEMGMYRWKTGLTFEVGFRVATGAANKIVECGFGYSR